MAKPKLDTRILNVLKEKTRGQIQEQSIRNALSRIRRNNPSLTLNAAAEVFAKKRGFSIARYLTDKDREALRDIRIEKVKIPSAKTRRKIKLKIIANYDTDDKLLRAHLKEINKTYTYGCYTACFILCRKVLENLLIHHILKKKFPGNTRKEREMYFDFNRRRFLDFEKILKNLRDHSGDFGPENKLVERICHLAGGFKETANEMTHSLYHIATKKEIDSKNFQHTLDLIKKLEETM